MQVSARWRAVLDLMMEVFKDERPADKIINETLRERKYIGSADRRFIVEQIWQIIRNRLKLEFTAGTKNPRRMLMVYLKDENLDEIFDGSKYGLEVLSEEEKDEKDEIASLGPRVHPGSTSSRADDSEDDIHASSGDLMTIFSEPRNDGLGYPPYVEAEVPEWIWGKMRDVGTPHPSPLPQGERGILAFFKALNQPATADFRINVKSREALLERLEKEGLEFEPTPYSPIGVRAKSRVNLNTCIAYQEGEMEVQDEASQIASLLVDANENDLVLDYCAGAGGKSLTVSYLLHNKGRILAHDINWARLEAIKDRIVRLGVKNIEVVRLPLTSFPKQTSLQENLPLPQGAREEILVTRFVIDAPCSGSGTWRRAPDAKFRLSPKELERLNKVQSEILEKAVDFVAIGGRIIYITCSIFASENEERAAEFLKNHPEFRLMNVREIWEQKIGQPYPYEDEFFLRMDPMHTHTDGFFIAIFERF